MKNIPLAVLIIVGAVLMIAAVICPLPPMLSLSGITWRRMIGLLGGFLIVFGTFSMIRGKRK